MNENKYFISDRDTVIAENLSLDIAIILLKALCETWWKDCGLRLTLGVMDLAIKAER